MNLSQMVFQISLFFQKLAAINGIYTLFNNFSTLTLLLNEIRMNTTH